MPLVPRCRGRKPGGRRAPRKLRWAGWWPSGRRTSTSHCGYAPSLTGVAEKQKHEIRMNKWVFSPNNLVSRFFQFSWMSLSLLSPNSLTVTQDIRETLLGTKPGRQKGKLPKITTKRRFSALNSTRNDTVRPEMESGVRRFMTKLMFLLFLNVSGECFLV